MENIVQFHALVVKLLHDRCVGKGYLSIFKLLVMNTTTITMKKIIF